MKRILAAFVVLGWMGLSTPRSPAQKPSHDLTAFLDTFVTSFHRLDGSTFRSLFSDDVSVFFPEPYRAERASGRAAVEMEFESVFRHFRDARVGPPYLDIRPRDLEVPQYKGFAIVTFHMGEAASVSRRTLVLVQRDRTWKRSCTWTRPRETPGSSRRMKNDFLQSPGGEGFQSPESTDEKPAGGELPTET